jgi:hypothetical protein
MASQVPGTGTCGSGLVRTERPVIEKEELMNSMRPNIEEIARNLHTVFREQDEDAATELRDELVEQYGAEVVVEVLHVATRLFEATRAHAEAERERGRRTDRRRQQSLCTTARRPAIRA